MIIHCWRDQTAALPRSTYLGDIDRSVLTSAAAGEIGPQDILALGATYPWLVSMPTANPFTILDTISIVWFCTAAMRMEPMMKTMQATPIESRRPIRSPVHDAVSAPSRGASGHGRGDASLGDRVRLVKE